MRAAEIEVLVTVDDKQVAAAEKGLKATGQRIEKDPLKVEADPKGALESLYRVEKEAKRIVSQRTMATVDANIERAEKQFIRVKERMDYLQSVAPELDVKADTARAEAAMQKVERQLNALRSAKATMEVDLDTAPVEEGFRRARGAAAESGEDAGDTFGAEMIAALVSIPIAGAVIGVGAAAAKALIGAFNEGLQIEKGYDRLAALTGLDETAAIRIGSAAGEAYANTFGESIEANMDTARLALQFDLVDDNATTAQAQRVIQSLAGIADVLGEDVQPVAKAVTQMLRTGVAKSADEAFDILATGAREGVNANEDLLDTFNEYSTQFRKLGLDGPQALGLINQGLRAGARDSDIAADALKEFANRASDPSMADAFADIGFSWEDLSSKIAAGGPTAAAALDEALDRIRAMPDPIDRAAAAATLFGTQSEDMAGALLAMDLTTAVDQLNGVQGAAQRMFDTLSSNSATKVEQAQRNIEVAADGIKGALAVAFSEPLGDFADWVSENRGPLLQFFVDLVNGAIDFSVGATEGFGDFVSGPLAAMVDGLATVIDMFNGFEGKPKELTDLADSMRNFDDITDQTVEGIEAMREKFNGFAEVPLALSYLNDTSLRLADALGQVGVAADGSATSGAALETQVQNTILAMQEQLSAAAATGEGQAQLQSRYDQTTGALVAQLEQMGYTKDEAQALIEKYGAVPGAVHTALTADSSNARSTVDQFVRDYNGKEIRLKLTTNQVVVDGRVYGGLRSDPTLNNARGNLVEFMAAGGLRGLTPMQPVAQMVSPDTWRVVGDRGDVPELYAPLDGSARSWALILEGLRRMPGSPPQMMAAGGITSAVADRAAHPTVQVVDNATYYSFDPEQVAREKDDKLRRALDAAGLN